MKRVYKKNISKRKKNIRKRKKNIRKRKKNTHKHKKNTRKHKKNSKKKKRLSRNAGMTWEELLTVVGSHQGTTQQSSIKLSGLDIEKERLFQTNNPQHVDLSGLGIDDNQLEQIIPALHEILRDKSSLNLSNNNITNFRPLRNLNLLESLNIKNQNMTNSGTKEAMDLKAISDLQNLQSLSVSNIKDVMPLVDLDNLKFLWLEGDNIKNMEKLSGMNLKDIPAGLHRYIVDQDDVKTPEQKEKVDKLATPRQSPNSRTQVDEWENLGQEIGDELAEYNYIPTEDSDDQMVSLYDQIFERDFDDFYNGYADENGNLIEDPQIFLDAWEAHIQEASLL